MLIYWHITHDQNSWSRASIDAWANRKIVTASWWFFFTAARTLKNLLSTVLIKDDKCWSWWTMAFASFTLFLFKTCMWRWRVVISADVVVPKSDFEISPTKLKNPRFDLDETIYYCVGGIWIVGMRSWIRWTVNTGHTLHLEEIQRFDYVTWGLTLWQYYNTACRLIISLAEELECVDPVFLSEVHFIGLFEQYSIVDFLDVLIWSGGCADRN